MESQPRQPHTGSTFKLSRLPIRTVHRHAPTSAPDLLLLLLRQAVRSRGLLVPPRRRDGFPVAALHGQQAATDQHTHSQGPASRHPDTHMPARDRLTPHRHAPQPGLPAQLSASPVVDTRAQRPATRQPPPPVRDQPLFIPDPGRCPGTSRRAPRPRRAGVLPRAQSNRPGPTARGAAPWRSRGRPRPTPPMRRRRAAGRAAAAAAAAGGGGVVRSGGQGRGGARCERRADPGLGAGGAARAAPCGAGGPGSHSTHTPREGCTSG